MLQHVLIAAIVAAGFVLVTGPFFIPELHKLKFGQSIREEGPKSHQKKSGTPTMGGIMIILGITLGTLAAAPWTPEVLLAVFIMLGHFVLGFLDDYIKVVKKRNLGLKARQKLAGQILIAVVTMYVATQVLGIDTDVWIPGLDANVSLGVLYYPLVLFVLVGTSNAVNLTDGLDGLAAGTVAIAASAFAVVSVLTGHGDLAYFCVAMAAACLAFLRFNAHPAKVFMGDTGSLALGGFVASMAYILNMPLFIPIVGLIYLIEIVSVMMQVTYFKLTHGKRIFKMTPIHHHFEKCGWSETRIVAVFTVITTLMVLVGLLGL